MRQGDSVTQKVTCLASIVITVPETNVFLNPDTDDCCFELPIFGDEFSDDDLKNDVTSFLRGFEMSTTAVSMFLTKPSDPDFVDVALVDDTYGTFYGLGFHTDALDRNYIGYSLNWKLILLAFGQGSYQLRYETTTILGPGNSGVDFAYCLKQFTADRADRTIRISFTNSFILQDQFDVSKQIYFPSNWENQIRLLGWFGGNNNDMEETVTKYNNKTLVDVTSRKIKKYRMRIDQAPAVVHNMVESYVLQADLKTITDFNRNNPWGHNTTAVTRPNEYKPTDTETELLMEVNVEWEGFYDTGVKEYC